jgi:UDP-N-acetylglucosamine acyltransferase
VIGRDNQIREHVTMHPGTAGGGGITRVGDDGLFMAAIHVAHDCQVGDGVIMANNATLGGHVEVQDHAYLGGLCAVHQFVRIGRQAMIGGLAGVEQDVIPYGMVLGNRAYLNGLNIVGMKRRDISREEIQDLRTAYRLLFAPEGAFVERLAEVAAQFADHSRVMEIVDFIRSAGNRAICMPRQNRNG